MSPVRLRGELVKPRGGDEIEGTLNNVETSLVGDTVAVTKRGRTRVVCTGHIMDRDEVG
jgi:hypothetical protein